MPPVYFGVAKSAAAVFTVPPISIPAANTPSRFTNPDGNKIHYLSFGAGGEAVVLIPVYESAVHC